VGCAVSVEHCDRISKLSDRVACVLSRNCALAGEKRCQRFASDSLKGDVSEATVGSTDVKNRHPARMARRRCAPSLIAESRIVLGAWRPDELDRDCVGSRTKEPVSRDRNIRRRARAKEAQNLETQRAARKCRADLSGKLVEMPSGRDRRRRARRCIDHGAPRRIPPRDHLCHFVVLAWHGAHHLVCDFAGLVRTPIWIDECGITPHRWNRTEHHAECNEVGAHDLDQIRSCCPWHAGGRGDQDLSGTRRSRAGAMRAKHLFPDLGRVVSHDPPSD